MPIKILDKIPFEANINSLYRKLHIQEGTEESTRVQQLLKEAQGIGRPKVLYKVAFVESKGDDFVVIDGIRFQSRIMRVNLDQVYRVFPFIATSGRELDEWSDGLTDVLENYWAGTIKEAALASAARVFESELRDQFNLGHLASMNPGSLEDWPIDEQKPLFELLGDPIKSIGVELTDSYLMVPIKSISGIKFPTEARYENCQLCQRENCPGRRAPYDPHLYESKYKRV